MWKGGELYLKANDDFSERDGRQNAPHGLSVDSARRFASAASAGSAKPVNQTDRIPFCGYAVYSN